MNLRFLQLTIFLCTWKYCCVRGNESGTNFNSERIEKEYCLNEEFQATCLKNEMIVIESAKYGRMRAGRCLDGKDFQDVLIKDPNFIGCSVDVTNLLNKKCFEKSDCTVVLLYDIDQKVNKPCTRGLENFLIARFRCISVVQADRSCKVPISPTAQHIQMTSSVSISDLQCGQRHQPWFLEAKPGQQIEVGILDFSKVKVIVGLNSRERDCSQYGYIIDKEANKNISICGAEKDREDIIYKSKSNKLEIFITIQAPERDDINVLISAQAVGCTSMVPPEDMWLRRRNQEAVVGCYSSRQTWYLNCVNNQWLGVIGNCTREMPTLNEVGASRAQPDSKSTVIVAVVIVLIGLIVCAAIIVCGILCIKRYEAKMCKTNYSKGIDANSKEWHSNPCRQQFLSSHHA